MVQKAQVYDVKNLAPYFGSFTATGAAGAVTLHRLTGKITTESLNTAADTTLTYTLTNTHIKATDMVFVSIARGTLTTGSPVVEAVTPANGSVVILIRNVSAAAAFNGTLVLSFFIAKTQ